jgi:hypothetical protein
MRGSRLLPLSIPVFFFLSLSACSKPAEKTTSQTSSVQKLPPEPNFVFKGKAKRHSGRQVLITASETSGQGDQVIRLDMLTIDSLQDSKGQAMMNYRVAKKDMRFEKSSLTERSGLVLEMVIDAPLKSTVPLIEGRAVLCVGTVKETVLKLSKDNTDSLSHSDLANAKVNATARFLKTLGLKLEGKDASKVNQVKLVPGPKQPPRRMQLGSTHGFTWEKMESLQPDAKIHIWMQGKNSEEPADWIMDVQPSASEKHPKLAIEAGVNLFPIWEVKLVGGKNNLINATLMTLVGEVAPGNRPATKTEGEQTTILLTGEGEQLNLKVLVSPDGRNVHKVYRFENLPIEE